MKTLKIWISGRVQGVGFRNFAQQTALRLKIKGTVRNLSDGRVEIAAQGEERSLENFCREIQQGPRGAHVEQIEILIEDRTEMSQFQITGW